MHELTLSRRGAMIGGAAVLAAAVARQDLSAAPASSPGTVPTSAPTPNLNWLNACDFIIEGRGWADSQGLFDRLPAKAKPMVREAVWGLSKNSAGLHIRFSSNAPTIHFRYSLHSATLSMFHMPATGMSGLDLYAKDSHEQWRWIDVVKPLKQDVEAELCKESDPAQREHLLYLPLYNGVKSLEIGVADGFELQPAAAHPKKPLVYYGTSIAQGGCASRPGMAHVSIIGRMIDRPMINLGFSGNGWMDPEMADLICEIDADGYIMDCMPNCTLNQVNERTEPLIRKICKAHPDNPLFMVTDPDWCNSPWSSSLRKTQHERRDVYLTICKRMADELPGIHVVDIGDVFSPDYEGTVDGVHPNDLGMTQLAARIAPIVESHLA